MKSKLILAVFIFLIVGRAWAAPDYLGVINKAEGTASFFNLKTHLLDFTVSVGYLPHEMVATPDGRWALISNYGKDHVRSTSSDNRPGHTLSVVDMRSRHVTEIELGNSPACAPHGMEISADGLKLYVTCEDRQEIVVIDLDRRTLSHTIPTAQPQSHMVVVDSREQRAYVSSFGGGAVTVLDLERRSIVSQIATGAGTEGVSRSPDGRFVYATAVLENKLVKIDARTLRVVDRVDTDRSPVRVVPTPDGRRLLVNNSASGTVQIFDSGDLSLIKTISVGKQPIGIVVPRNDRAYVANMRDDTVAEIDLVTLSVTRVTPTGKKPDGLAYVPSIQ